MRRVLLASLLVLATGLSFAATTAGPAIAIPTMTFQISPTATLVARGAAAQAGVVYSCSRGTPTPSLFVTVTQVVSGGRASQGGGSPDNLICDGKKRALNLPTVTGNAIAFGRGTAFAQGGIVSCDAAFNCTDVAASKTITIR